jgi:hypothetical protein
MTKAKYVRDFFIVLIIFFITRLVIISSIVFIKQSPLSPDCTSYKWASENVFITLPYKFTRMYICADAPDTRRVRVYLNDDLLDDIVLTAKTDMYCVNANPKSLKETNQIRLAAYIPDAHTKEKDRLWRLCDIRTDKNINKSILKEQNLLFTQKIKTLGLSGSKIEDSGDGLKNTLLQGLSKWDANIYAGIINGGYSYNENNIVKQNIVFPFMFPLAGYLFKLVLGCDAVWAGVAVNNLMFFLGLLFIYYLSRQLIEDEPICYLPIILMCVHPFSVFLVSAYSEGLFILIASISIYVLYKRKYKLFPLFAGMLSAVRIVGIVAPAILVYDYFVIQKNKFNIKNIVKTGALSALSLWGILVFMAYSAIRFNEPAAMFKNQNAWTPGKINAKYMLKHLTEPFVNAGSFMEPEILGMGIAVAVLLFSFWFIIKNRATISRLEYILAVASLAFMLVPLIFYNKSESIHPAMGRYTLLSFPVFILVFSRGDIKKIPGIILYTIFSVFTLVLMTARFSWGLTPY